MRELKGGSQFLFSVYRRYLLFKHVLFDFKTVFVCLLHVFVIQDAGLQQLAAGGGDVVMQDHPVDTAVCSGSTSATHDGDHDQCELAAGAMTADADVPPVSQVAKLSSLNRFFLRFCHYIGSVIGYRLLLLFMNSINLDDVQ